MKPLLVLAILLLADRGENDDDVYRLSEEKTKDSIYHHLCALDLF